MTSLEIYILIFLLVTLNGFFSVAEFAIVSSRKSKLQTMSNNGDFRATEVLKIQSNPTNLIIVIQIGLNLIAIISGLFGEQNLVPILAKKLALFEFTQNTIELLSSAIIVFGITSIFIIFGELVPKKIVYLNPEEYACKIIKYLNFILFTLKPLVTVYGIIADFILKLFKINPIKINDMTFEDVSAVIDEGVDLGVLMKNESKIIKNVLDLTEKNIYQTMTIKDNISFLDINNSPHQIKEKILEHPYSRFLVCDGVIDNLLGYIDSKDILIKILNNQNVDFNREKLQEQGLKKIIILPETLNLLDTLDKFRESRENIACVINEFGKIVGIITVNDVLSTLMGNVLYNHETDGFIVKRDNNSWLIDGLTDMKDICNLFDWKDIENSEHFETISGFLMYHMKCLPKKAQKYTYKNVCFEIVDIDKYRIDEIMATLITDTTNK